MMMNVSIALVFCLAVFADGCETTPTGGRDSAPSNAQQTASAAPANSSAVQSEGRPAPGTDPAAGEPGASAGPDVCALIEKSEIASVQGQPVQSVTPGGRTSGALLISQCYYSVISADGSKNLSVHLQVIRSAAKSPGRNVVRDFWEEKLMGEKGQAEEEEKDSGERLRVQGLGDEAFWIGNSITGAIYVLKNDVIVRVSVGGPDDAKTKIEKASALARTSLQRLK
jgi:hypothetical protein